MQKFQGKSGDGIGALGLKQTEDGKYELVSVETVIRDEPPFLRKSGMGGARYLRHCLEAVVLQRGGLWMPETMENALGILEKLDGGRISDARFETWVYVQDGQGVKRVTIADSNPEPDCPLQARNFTDKDITWPALLTQVANQSAEELSRPSLKPIWIDRYARVIEHYPETGADDGRFLSALLTRQAVAQRRFLVETAQTGEFAVQPFLSMLAARYVRALCQFELSAGNKTFTNPLAPDPTEVARTMLLLCAAGRVPEAMELGARIDAYIKPETLFVPVAMRFALSVCTNRDELLDLDAPTFGTTLLQDTRQVIGYLRGQDRTGPGDAINRIIHARSRQMGSYSDEYHLDFDDELSMGMPYEACAILEMCRYFRRDVPVVDHPMLALPTARVPDLSGVKLPLQETYAVFMARRPATHIGGH